MGISYFLVLKLVVKHYHVKVTKHCGDRLLSFEIAAKNGRGAESAPPGMMKENSLT